LSGGDGPNIAHRLQRSSSMGLARRLSSRSPHSDLALKLEPDYEQVGDQDSPDLDEHGIIGSAVRGLDLQGFILDYARRIT